MVIGIGLILLGPAIIVERRATPAPVAPREQPDGGAALSDPPESGFELRQMDGYLFAFIAAIAYGSSPVLIRAVLEDASASRSSAASYPTWRLRPSCWRSCSCRAGGRWPGTFQFSVFRAFAPAGVFVFVAQMLRFISLPLASVAVVTTFLRFGGLFTLLFSWWLNRSLERITWRLVAGVLMSLGGAMLLVLTRVD